MKFKLISPGSFLIGKFSPTVSMVGFFSNDPEPINNAIYTNAQKLANQDYQEGFTAEVKKEFYIGIYEVSQKEWKTILNTNPSHFNNAYLNKNTDDQPVENISWKDCKKFIRELNKKEKGEYKYRLPTEAEWEYAARAGNRDDIPWPQIWHTAHTGSQLPVRIGTKSPNAWGLYDMLGNVWEWVEDGYNEKLFAENDKPTKTKGHVIKGSCFYGDVKNATYMTHAGAKGKRYDIGLRLVLETTHEN